MYLLICKVYSCPVVILGQKSNDDNIHVIEVDMPLAPRRSSSATRVANQDVVHMDNNSPHGSADKSIDLFNYEGCASPLSSFSTERRRRSTRAGQQSITSPNLEQVRGPYTPRRKQNQRSIKEAFRSTKTRQAKAQYMEDKDAPCHDAPKQKRRKKGDPEHQEWLCKGFKISEELDKDGEVQYIRARCVLCIWSSKKLPTNYSVYKRGVQSASWSGPK